MLVELYPVTEFDTEEFIDTVEVAATVLTLME